MSSRTIAISATVHLGLAASLFLVAGSRQAREAISIAVFSEKKKPPPPPKPSQSPKPSPKPANPKLPPPSRPEAAQPEPNRSPAPVPEPASKPVALDSLELSSDDVAGAVIIPVQRRPTAAPQKVAMIAPGPPPSDRGRRAAEEERRCDEPPTKPEPTYRVEIEFLAQARAEGVEGRLVMRIHVAPNGTVENVEILSPVHPALDAAAVATVMQWRFRPAMACGRPASGVYTLARKFELGD